MMLHNSHRIRPYPNQECPSGIPDILYELPECNGEYMYSSIRILFLASREEFC